MKLNVQLQHPNWQHAGGTHIRGCPWLDGVRLDAARLDDLWKGLGWRDAVALVHRYDGEFPKKRFKEFLEYIDITEEKFWEVVDRYRNPNLWEKVNGEWKLKYKVSNL